MPGGITVTDRKGRIGFDQAAAGALVIGGIARHEDDAPHLQLPRDLADIDLSHDIGLVGRQRLLQ